MSVSTLSVIIWPPYVIGQAIIFLPCGFYLSNIFFPRLIAAASYFHTWCGPSANLECRSEMYCTRLAGNTGPKKSPCRHHHTTLPGYIFATKARIGNRKNLLNSNNSPICPYNTANFSPLAAGIRWRVWGTPANFYGFRVLAALLHGL